MGAKVLNFPKDEECPPVARGESCTVKRAAGMSRRDLLVALRDNIAEQIDEGIQPRDLAALSKRLLDIAREIEILDAATDGDEVGNAAETPDEQWDTDGG